MIFFMIFVISCSKKISKEVSPYYIKINGPMADRKQEISGMDWYEDNLFLLPENLNGYVFLIKKSELESRINKTDTSAITPQKLNLKHLTIRRPSQDLIHLKQSRLEVMKYIFLLRFGLKIEWDA